MVASTVLHQETHRGIRLQMQPVFLLPPSLSATETSSLGCVVLTFIFLIFLSKLVFDQNTLQKRGGAVERQGVHHVACFYQEEGLSPQTSR